MLVRQIVAFHRTQRLMYARIKCLAHCRNRVHLQLAQDIFHLLHNQFHARAQLLCRSGRLERQLKVVQDRQKLLHHRPGRVIAILHALPLGPLAGILKLRLQARQTVHQLIALALHLVELFAAYRRAYLDRDRFFRRLARPTFRRFHRCQFLFLFRHRSS